MNRGVSAAATAELVAQYPKERIQTMIELHDWHYARRQPRGAGFIVAGIRSSESYAWPQGFKPSAQTDENSRIRPVQEKRSAASQLSTKPPNDELAPFLAFWHKLAASAQADFEWQSLAQADAHKRRWFDEARSEGRETANYFRLAILNDTSAAPSHPVAEKTCQRHDLQACSRHAIHPQHPSRLVLEFARRSAGRPSVDATQLPRRVQRRGLCEKPRPPGQNSLLIPSTAI